MARKRLKDKSDFSVTIKFPARYRAEAMKILNVITFIHKNASFTEQTPENQQEYFYVLVQIA